MANEKQIKKSAVRTDKWLKARQKKHTNMVIKSIESMQKSIIDNLTLLDTKSGRVEGLKVNLRNAQKIQAKVEQIFANDYNTDTKKIIDDFKNTPALITSAYNDLDEAVKFTSIDRRTMDILRDGDYQNYLSIGTLQKDKIVQSIYDQVIGNGRFSDLVATIEGALLGNTSVTGRSLAQYSRLYARDFIMNFHNDVNIQKGEDIGLTDFLYLGNIIATSRPFCKSRVGKTYTKDQINSWTYKWKGKSGPAMTHRGGYNCRHHWQPIRKEWLDGQKKINVGNWFKE